MVPSLRPLPPAALLVLLLVGPLAAHELDTSYTRATVAEDEIKLVLAFDVVDLGVHFGLDADRDGEITGEELLAGREAIFRFAREAVALSLDYRPVGLEAREAWFSHDAAGNFFMNLELGRDLDRLPGQLSLRLEVFDLFGPGHKNLARIRGPGGETGQWVLTDEGRSLSFEPGGTVPVARQAAAFTRLGVEHIFIGFDHILFLIALILPGARFLELVKIVTAFTVAHSLTLALAALEVVILPAALIEAGIALSIAYVAAENLARDEIRHRWVLTFLFGLVHGFGFANVLRELGLPTEGLAVSLLAFNLGVEIGQVAIVALLFPLALALARQRFQRPVQWALSAVVLLFGLGWFVERAFGLAFMPI